MHYEFSAQFYKEKKGAIGFDEDVCYYLRNGSKVLVKNNWTECKTNGCERADIFK